MAQWASGPAPVITFLQFEALKGTQTVLKQPGNGPVAQWAAQSGPIRYSPWPGTHIPNSTDLASSEDTRKWAGGPVPVITFLQFELLKGTQTVLKQPGNGPVAQWAAQSGIHDHYH